MPALIDVPAPAAPRTRSLAARRHSLTTGADAVDRLVAWMVALRRGGPDRWRPLADAAGLPLGEVVASPFGLRAVALGVATGATTAHVETRALLPWPDGFGDATADPRHGTWEAGRLFVGKYQSFQADAPHATYDPSHVAKWGPHELMHRASGFFFSRNATRFEHYLGARLNELLPVTLWYGHDQLARLDEDRFVRARARHGAEIEDARWLDESEPALRRRVRRTLASLREGIAHFEAELAAIDREISAGRRVETPVEIGGAQLNAASDATAYVVGHLMRLRDPSVAALLDSLPSSLGRFETVGAYRAHVEHVHDALLFERVRVDADTLAARRARRTIWDWLHRAAHAGVDVRPLLRRARPELRDEQPVDEVRWLATLVGTLGDDLAGAVLADGVVGVALSQLRDGVRSVMPRVESALDDDALTSFATSEALAARSPLGRRLENFLAAAEAPTVVRELATLERAIAEARPSDEATFLSETPPSRLREGVLLGNVAFEVVRATHDVVAVHAGHQGSAEAAEVELAWLVGAHAGEVSILTCEPDELALYERACGGAVTVKDAGVDAAWVREALAAGALAWRPR